MDKNDGGSAFPQVESQQVGSQGEYHTEVYSAGGMSLRDYFAAKIMATFLHGAVLPPGFDASEQIDFTAGRAYECADALLRARLKTPNDRSNLTKGAADD